MCLYPVLIKNRKYTETKKNGGIIPPVLDRRTLAVPVGCGNCIECRKQKARGWQLRLLEEVKENNNGIFITLTFSNDSIWELVQEIPSQLTGYERDNAIAKLGVKRFLGRWRKKYGKSLRHWLVTELGHNGTENIHMHGIVWSKHGDKELENIWQYGYIWKGDYVSERTVNYIIKYITKQDEKHREYKSRVLCSPGIGSNYVNTADARDKVYKPNNTVETYRTDSGHKVAMPIYWRNKIYNDKERELLWIEKLDKQERFVGGEKVSTKDGYDEYYKLLEWHREINERLGYGTSMKDWQQQEYEIQRRQYLLDERIAKRASAPRQSPEE